MDGVNDIGQWQVLSKTIDIRHEFCSQWCATGGKAGYEGGQLSVEKEPA